MTHLTLTRLSPPRPLAGCHAASVQDAWDWIAHTIAKQFNVTSDDEPGLVGGGYVPI